MKKPLPNNASTILRLFDVRLEKEIIEKYDLSIAPTALPDSVRERMIRRYTYLFKFRLRFRTNEAHYADVQQEVALALLIAWPKWDRKRGYFGHIATMYVVRMLREYESRMCYSATLPKDYFSRKKLYSFHDPQNFIANVSQGEEDRREDHYATFEDKRTVSQCLRCLPHMQRKTVEMKYFKGMDEKSIGEALGYSRQYVYILLNQAYERMRVYTLMLKPEEV